MSLASDKAQPGPARVEFADPHAATSASSESEATRVRKLAGGWRWLLVLATAATILLCINQQFTLRFFIGYTQLNTEYYYLLILCMLPFTFVIFPGSTRAPLDRVPWYDVVLFLATIASAFYLMLNVRKAAELGWEFGGAPFNVIAAGLVDVGPADGGAAPHRRVEPAAERVPVYRVPAVCGGELARTAQGQPVDAGAGHGLPRSLQREPARHPDPGVRRDRDRVPRVRHRPDADGGRQVLHQSRLRPVRHVPRRRRQGRHLRQRAARHDVGQRRLQCADRRHHDDTDHEADGLQGLLCRRHRGLRVDRRGARSAGDGRNRLRHRPVPQHQLRRGGAGRHHPGRALLPRPLHPGRCLRRPPRPQGPAAPRAAERLADDQGGLVLPAGGGAADRHASPLQAREPRAVLCDRAAAGAEPAVLQGPALGPQDHRQLPARSTGARSWSWPASWPAAGC